MKRWRGINWPFEPVMSAHAGNCQAEITAIRTRTTNDYSYGQVSEFRHWAREPTQRALRPHTPRDRVAQQHRERVALPGAPERERCRVRRIGRARRPDRRVVAVAESEVGDAALADRARVAEHTRLSVLLQRRVRRIQGADRGRSRGRTVVRGQEYARRLRILELDEIRLVLDDERWTEPARQARVAAGHVDADLADRRMGQEVASEERVVLGLHGPALAHAFHTLGAAAAGAVQAEPASAGFEPLLEAAALCGVGVRAGHVGDQQATHGQPLLDIAEVVGDRRGDLPLGQEPGE